MLSLGENSIAMPTSTKDLH